MVGEFKILSKQLIEQLEKKKAADIWIKIALLISLT